jgi:hypothetical protein
MEDYATQELGLELNKLLRKQREVVETRILAP